MSAEAKRAQQWNLLKHKAVQIPMRMLESFLLSVPQGPSKFAIILSQKAKQLLALSRYEQRALSRRKFAIREFDADRRCQHRA